MIAAWMVYALLVGALVTAAAHLVERVGRWAGRPTRWIWAGAMVLAIGLAARGPLTTRVPAARGTFVLPTVVESTGATQPNAWNQVVAGAARVARAALGAPASLQRLAGRGQPYLANANVAAAWAAISIILGALFLQVYGRFRRARSQWPRAVIHGVPVRVAPDTGPAVVGLARPDVVVPRWLLERASSEQRMVVVHESEHIRARDPLLLALACIVTLLAPWNAALWYILSRLRLAIELDCDARVLRGGATPASYGALLIDVAERASPLRVSALALADESSHLNQRILAMYSRPPRFVIARGAAAAALALVALLAACETTMLESVQVDPANPSWQKQAALQLSHINSADTAIRYLIDGVEVTPVAARTVDPTRVASIDVRKSPGARPEVHIRLLGRGQVANVPNVPRKAPPDSASTHTTRGLIGVAMKTPTGNLEFFLNGVRVDSAAIFSLDRDSIESVEVIKGATVMALYNVPEGTGVIAVHTKAAKPPM